ncbi:MAG: M20/M25/M40 family metallo-hydrolase [Caldilineaceae bacterium]|nr:M20/M25/M40 family metallo-hydrolase [Caldilineaceae bacterium]
MQADVIELTQKLIAIPSETTSSNAAINDFLQEWLTARNFTVERLSYLEPTGEEKVNLVAKLGTGQGGLGFFSHSDTVPGDAREWEPFAPTVADGKLYGRGSCDMKGPLAATLIAAASIDPARLRKPLYLAIAADEEQGHHGAHYMQKHSRIFQEGWPTSAVVPEPTELQPVYAHKGRVLVTVTALGRAAHTSTDRGLSANFLIAPFIAEMAELATFFKSTERFKNYEFDPPTNGFNMTIDDGQCRTNVTAAKTVVSLSIRLMPNDHHEEQVAMIAERAQKYNLAVEVDKLMSFYIDPQAEIVQASCRATGVAKAISVPYGTEAESYQNYTQCVILGPGNIAQAHTIGEWIELKQLVDAVGAYQRLIADFCL